VGSASGRFQYPEDTFRLKVQLSEEKKKRRERGKKRKLFEKKKKERKLSRS